MEFSQEQADRHNAFTHAGWEIAKGEMILHGGPTRPHPGFFLRRKLRKAIRLFSAALKVNPDGWSSMWALGKIHQRLGEHETAFQWFQRAHRINPSQIDVAREAGLAAMDSGHTAEGVDLCFAAVRLVPDDLGLQCNLALAYLLAGDDARADECARVAVQGDPTDKISETVLRFVQDVKAGRKPRPSRLSAAFPVC